MGVEETGQGRHQFRCVQTHSMFPGQLVSPGTYLPPGTPGLSSPRVKPGFCILNNAGYSINHGLRGVITDYLTY